MTERKFNELKRQVEKLKNFSRPQAAAEVARLAELGDFSENAEYQLAKGRLRGINSAIIRLENHLNQAVIIAPDAPKDTVRVGHTVTIERDGQQKTYQLLGSAETNPEKGIISYNSPLGSALIGYGVGEEVTIKLAEKETVVKIVKIE